jgi:outer membrane receptor protein involved in Fe transport
MKLRILTLFFLSNLITTVCLSQTTGKITGKISDVETSEALIGVNIMLLGTNLGTATDINGDFFLLNLPPGSYNLSLSMIGYKNAMIEEVRVSVNRTTPLTLKMAPSVLEGDVVVVKADQVSIKKDQTSSVKNISSDQIDIMPVENIGQIIGMQAGIVAGHFRGGRSTEVTYLVDGIKVDEVYGGSSSTTELETGSVSELEVITGTFNAEYGKAMSGVVNQVTKSGGDEFKTSLQSGYANYITSNVEVFPGIDQLDENRSLDYRFQLSGPIIKGKVNFFVNYRLEDNYNHLNGLHYFNPTDKSNYLSDSSSSWLSEHTGEHEMESHCMSSKGVAILDEENHYIFDESVCVNEYGECEILLSVCSFNQGIIPTHNQLYCERELSGTFIENYTVREKMSKTQCIALGDYYENTTDMNNPYKNTIFIPGVDIGYHIGTPSDIFVPLNATKNSSLFSKITFHIIDDLRFSILHSRNKNNWIEYNHYYKYNPFGLPKSESSNSLTAMQWNYMITRSFFIEGKHSYTSNYYGRYLFKNPYSTGYISDNYSAGVPGFSTGGMDKSHTRRTTTEHTSSIKLNMQLNRNHSLKTGLDYSDYKINNKEYLIIENPDSSLVGVYSAYIQPDSIQSPDDDIFDVNPSEFSFFIQDKAEYDEMVINLGLRYDYFNPNCYYPSDYRNPANTISNVSQSDSLVANEFSFWSPRLGIAYQVADAAIVHFSYGHFFQMPPMYSMYAHNNWIVPTGDYETVLGNPNIEAEKTVTYEIGLWQKLNALMALEINMFYRDIYNLLGTKVLKTYNQVKYGLYSNKDYGNVRGLELKYDVNFNALAIYCNYTLQYTRGNADTPLQSFNREGENKDPVSKLIPMSWDQRHTFNTTLAYNRDDFGLTATAYYNSGTPYTFEPVSQSVTALINLLPNNDYKPANYSVDVTGYYRLWKNNDLEARLSFSIYNLFDTLNDIWVYPKTGRAYSNIVNSTEILGYRSTFTDVYDQYENPAMYSAPRQIKLNLAISYK